MRGRGDVSYVGWTTLCCVFLTWGVQHIPRRFLHCVYIFFSYMDCTTFSRAFLTWVVQHFFSYMGCTTFSMTFLTRAVQHFSGRVSYMEWTFFFFFFLECFLHGVYILGRSYLGCFLNWVYNIFHLDQRWWSEFV